MTEHEQNQKNTKEKTPPGVGLLAIPNSEINKRTETFKSGHFTGELTSEGQKTKERLFRSTNAQAVSPGR